MPLMGRLKHKLSTRSCFKPIELLRGCRNKYKTSNMLWEIISILLVFFVVSVICAYLTWNNSYFQRYGVPHEKPTFFFGNFKDVVYEQKHIGVLVKEIYNKFNYASYAGYFKFNTPVFIIRDPELIKNILVRDFQHFVNNNTLAIAQSDPLYLDYNAFAAVDDVWRATRAYMSPCFTSNKIKTMFSHMEEKSENMVLHLGGLCQMDAAKDVDVKNMTSKYATDVIASAVFGFQSDSFSGRNSTFRQISESMSLRSFRSGLILMLIMVFPALRKLFNKFRFGSQTTKLMVEISKEIISNRERNGIVKNDFFQQMIALRKLHGDKVFSDIYIASQAFGFLVDGFDTTSTLMAYTLFEIGKNTDVQSKLRNEILEIFEANESKLPYDELNNLSYFDMVISEVLRIHPPGLVLEKLCTKTYVLPPATPTSKEVTIEAGTVIAIPVYSLHMDPLFFPSPEQMNPENFTNDSISSRPKCTYLPFGEGPRSCYGSRLAIMQTKIAIAKILLHFDVRTTKDCLASGYEIDPRALLKKATKDLRVHFYKL